jgi:hypothetical protein
MGYLRGCRYPVRMSYLAQRQDKKPAFWSEQFCCMFIRDTYRYSTVCRREPQYILVAHYALVNIIYFVVDKYFSYTRENIFNCERHEVLHYFILIRTVWGTVSRVRLFLAGLGSIPGHFLWKFMVDTVALGRVSPHELRIFLSLSFHLWSIDINPYPANVENIVNS